MINSNVKSNYIDTDINDKYMREYDILRAEIMQNIKLFNSLTTLTLTAVMGFLGYLVSTNSIRYSLYVIPVPIILSLSIRVLYYRRKISEISSYMIVFLEKKIRYMNWETLNNKFENKTESNHWFIEGLKYFRYTEFIVLIIACAAVYLVKIYNDIGIIFWDWRHFCVLIVFLISLILEYNITKVMNKTDHYREECINKWIEIKNK